MKRLAVCLFLALSIGGSTGLIASGYLLAGHHRNDALLTLAGFGIAVAGLACLVVTVGSYLKGATDNADR
jgi:hypothetical protein